jgi:GntR family transcriptional regulator
VNTNTVTRAYAELHRAGLIETRQGVGTFVQGITRKPASADRRERLAGVAETAIAEAAAIGFGPDDLIEMVQSIAIGEN